VNPSRSSLVIGERVISRCEDGLLVAEYALFDPAEVILAAAAGQGVQEQGYFTTAGTARERLYAEGVTSQLARDTFSALRPRHLRALARSPSVLQAIEVLGPYEAFEGGTFDASTGTYRGAWLDMAALALACPLRNASLLLQAIHLSQVIDEVSDDVPVRLLTANVTGGLRVGERTWSKVHLETARRLPAVLRAMRVPARSKAAGSDDGVVREELLQGLRARSAGTKIAQPRIRTLATLVARTGKTPPPSSAIDEGWTPSPAPRTPPPPSIERRIAEGVSAGTDPMALFEELRGHTQLLRGEDHLRAVAHFLSGMAERSPSQPEIRVLASKAWLAAGEPGPARQFSRQVIDNPSVQDSVRLLALEIIEATDNAPETLSDPTLPEPTPSDPTLADPSLATVAEPSLEAPPIIPMPILMAVPHEQFAPAGASMPPFAPEPPRQPVSRQTRRITRPTFPKVTPLPPREEHQTLLIRTPAPPRETPGPIIATPVYIVDSPAIETPRPAPPQHAALLAPPPKAARSEIVESLSMPDGLNEAMLPRGMKPSTPDQARIAMTRLSRTLGRDYRLWYGTTLMTNAIAIETMQRHLRRRFEDASADKQQALKLETELTRHGALLSEILARSLGGTWVDVSGAEPGHWAMVIHPNTRVWPIGRVYRFFQQGHREADLVAFFLDLEAEARRGS
jgi:hypothetical protein